MGSSSKGKTLMKRRSPTTPGRIFLWFLDQAYLHKSETCYKYGGMILTQQGRQARVCSKTRWHFDSHYYDTYVAMDNINGAISPRRPRESRADN